MNHVQPIRDKKVLHDFLEVLKKRRHKKMYMVAYLGVYSGLRISDMLELTVADVREKDHLYVKEAKTDNVRRIKINNILRKELDDYIKGKPDDEFLFRKRDENTPISRQYTHQILQKTAKQVGIKDPISNHSLRKTFGYHMYMQTKDVALLQEIFGHAAPSVTLRYICVTDDIIDVAMDHYSVI